MSPKFIPTLLLALGLTPARADEVPAAIERYFHETFPAREITVLRSQDLNDEPVETQEECHAYEFFNKNEGVKDFFCVELSGTKTLANGRSYAIFSGENQQSSSIYGYYFARLVRFSPTGTVEVSGEIQESNWHSHTPERWQWLQFGPDSWGVRARTTTAVSGVSTGTEVLLFEQQGKVANSIIDYAISDNSNWISTCEEERRKELGISEEECIQPIKDLIASFNLRSDLQPTAGIYPLEFKVSGYIGLGKEQKKMQQQSFIWIFDSSKQTYKEPEDNPLKLDQP